MGVPAAADWYSASMTRTSARPSRPEGRGSRSVSMHSEKWTSSGANWSVLGNVFPVGGIEVQVAFRAYHAIEPTSAAPKLTVNEANRSSGKRRIAPVISSTSAKRRSPLLAIQAKASSGSARKRYRAALMQ